MVKVFQMKTVVNASCDWGVSYFKMRTFLRYKTNKNENHLVHTRAHNWTLGYPLHSWYDYNLLCPNFDSTCTITVISDCMSFDIILSVSWGCPLAPIEIKIPKYQYTIPIYLNISDYMYWNIFLLWHYKSAVWADSISLTASLWCSTPCSENEIQFFCTTCIILQIIYHLTWLGSPVVEHSLGMPGVPCSMRVQVL